MTVLKEYQRLETTGVWHASASDQRRDVIVSLGDATLTISDTNMVALSHWSLPAIQRRNPGERPAVFGPGGDQAEVLELDDDTMIAAIEKIRTVIQKRKPQPGRLRQNLLVGVVIAVAALAIFWLPGALIRQTVAVVPVAKRQQLGQVLLSDIRRVAGRPCETTLGRRALDRLHARLLPGEGGQIIVLSDGVRQAAHLPGGIILLNRALVEDYEDPAVAAGYILAENEAARRQDPLHRLLTDAGMIASFRLLTTGDLPGSALDAHAEHLLTQGPAAIPDQNLLARFDTAGLSSAPYAYAMDVTGETTLPLIEADPVTPQTARPVMPDGDWISLQGICGE